MPPAGRAAHREGLLIVCEECGMQTSWIPVGDDKNAALDQAGEIWNQRLNRPAATEGDLLDLIRKEIR
jgi:hypothetical protein